MNNAWYEWLSVNEVARLVGVTPRAIYIRIKQGLAAEDRRGKTCVRPIDAYNHFASCGRRPAGLMEPPPDTDAQAPASTEPTLEPGELVVHPDIAKALNGVNPLDLDPDELTFRLGLAGVPRDRVMPLVQTVRLKQSRRALDMKAGKSFAPDDVAKMLRKHADLLVAEIDAAAPIFAQHLVRTLLTQYGVDLAAKHPAIAQSIENEVRSNVGNGIIARMHQLLQDQVKGVKPLELSA